MLVASGLEGSGLPAFAPRRRQRKEFPPRPPRDVEGGADIGHDRDKLDVPFRPKVKELLGFFFLSHERDRRSNQPIAHPPEVCVCGPNDGLLDHNHRGLVRPNSPLAN